MVLANQLVLGSARIGLIFTRSQEGTQPGWLTQTGQTKQGIQYHVLSCSVLSGEAGWREVNSGSGAPGIGRQELLCAFPLFLLCILIVVATVHFVCSSVKLPLSWPMSSAVFFLSILLPNPAGGGVTEQPCGPLLPARTKLRHRSSWPCLSMRLD